MKWVKWLGVSVVMVTWTGTVLADALSPRAEERNPAGKTAESVSVRKPGDRKSGNRPFQKFFFSRLTPAERVQVNRLAREGKKEELRREMRRLRQKYRPAELKKLEELRSCYLKTDNAEEREKLREKMHRLCETLFRRRQAFTRRSIERTEKQLELVRKNLARLKQYYELKEKKASEMIERQVDFYCQSPEQRRAFQRQNRKKPQPPKSPSLTPAGVSVYF